jgi:acetoin utilization protein AcuB
MKIKYWMTKDPITVSPDLSVLDAQKIMQENKIRRLPVTEKGKLVGIVTFRNLMEAAPSSATSLSIYELNYLIMKMKVKDLMKKNVVTVSTEDTVVDAIALGMKHDIGGFPVLNPEGELVGIVTETQIARAMMQLFGTNVKEEIIHIENIDLQAGTFGKIVSIAEKMGATIISMFSVPKRSTDLMRVYLRVKPGQQAKEKVVAELQNAGFMIEE